jgi:hypothetical protein
LQPDSKAIQVLPQQPLQLKIAPPTEPAWPQQPGCCFSGRGLPAPGALCSQRVPMAATGPTGPSSPSKGAPLWWASWGFLKPLPTCYKSLSSTGPLPPLGHLLCLISSSLALFTSHAPLTQEPSALDTPGSPGMSRNVNTAAKGPHRPPRSFLGGMWLDLSCSCSQPVTNVPVSE